MHALFANATHEGHLFGSVSKPSTLPEEFAEAGYCRAAGMNVKLTSRCVGVDTYTVAVYLAADLKGGHQRCGWLAI